VQRYNDVTKFKEVETRHPIMCLGNKFSVDMMNHSWDQNFVYCLVAKWFGDWTTIFCKNSWLLQGLNIKFQSNAWLHKMQTDVHRNYWIIQKHLLVDDITCKRAWYNIIASSPVTKRNDTKVIWCTRHQNKCTANSNLTKLLQTEGICQ